MSILLRDFKERNWNYFFRFAYDKNGNEIGVCINNGYYRDNFMAIIEDVRIRIL